jgi:ferric-dicitrate binding protein FerR (iron transport regulator)
VQIARTIARWYDLDVQIADVRLQRRLVTADFDTQSPKEMIAALATAVGANVERHGRTLVIRPGQ